MGFCLIPIIGSLSKASSSILFLFLLTCFCFPSTEAYGALDPNKNITIKWDIISWTPDGYIAEVTLTNFQQYRHIAEAGWTLGWTWAEKEVIWNLMGGQATEQGDCSKFKANLPQCCKNNPTIVNLLPGTLLFQISVGIAGTTYKTVKVPKNFTLNAPGPGFTCGPVKIVQPTNFIARMSWDVTCTYTQFLAQETPTCILFDYVADKY